MPPFVPSLHAGPPAARPKPLHQPQPFDPTPAPCGCGGPLAMRPMPLHGPYALCLSHCPISAQLPRHPLPGACEVHRHSCACPHLRVGCLPSTHQNTGTAAPIPTRVCLELIRTSAWSSSEHWHSRTYPHPSLLGAHQNIRLELIGTLAQPHLSPPNGQVLAPTSPYASPTHF